MSEIALDANFVALARSKDEQFLSMLKPKKTRGFLGAENAKHFLVNHLFMKWFVTRHLLLASGS